MFMERDWETTFHNWSKPSSDTERQKSENAEKAIRAAISESPELSKRNIIVFPQGSYRNNTNVRQDSDVDICVLCRDVFFYEFYKDLVTKESAAIEGASYQYSTYKNEIETALVKKFGRDMVRRGNKAFDIHENTYRVDADVVACFLHRLYYRDSNGQVQFCEGTELHPDNGGRIINWPNQHYENGVTKNNATSGRFKFITRIIKRLRNEMDEKGFLEAKPIPSYLLECLVWNTPNEGFGHVQYTADVRYVLAHTFNETLTYEKCQEWVEVNGIKYLFHSTQPWTREQAHAFLSTAWSYIGFQ
jgi:hypothetical protein